MGRREVRFYDQLAPELSLRVPRVYGSAYDEHDGSFVILMEDLAASGCTVSDGTVGVAPDAAARALARRDDVRFVIVGDGPLRPEVEAEARALGASSEHVIDLDADPAVEISGEEELLRDFVASGSGFEGVIGTEFILSRAASIDVSSGGGSGFTPNTVSVSH